MGLNEVLNTIKNSPFYLEIQKRDREKIVKGRHTKAKELEQLEKEAMALVKDHKANLEKVESDIETLKKKIEQKKQMKAKIERQYHSGEHKINLEKNACLAFLKDTADRRIDETIHLFSQMFWIKRSSPPSHEVEAAMNFFRSGKETLREMKLVPELDEKKFKTLLTGLSKIGLPSNPTN